MKLIVGLGNPGKEYLWTRHNFGFLALDFYSKLNPELKFKKHSKFAADFAKVGDTIFIKPTCFYNAIGPVVANFLNFYKIPTTNLLVISDDFNLPFGTLRGREKGSSGGNNGLKSIIETLKTDEFSRVRAGTDSPLREKIGDTDFVLGRFSGEEKARLPETLKSMADKIDAFIK
jgi:PTH1 family peptidyl-tRNA hydrolase